MFATDLTEGVRCTVDDRGVAVVTFAHPRSNSLPGAVLAELADTIRGLGERSDVRVVVLGSAGDRAFCAGASFDELVAISDEAEGFQFFMGFANVINAMRSIPQLIVGRVQGKAVGGGVGVASAVDYCLATKHAAVKLSELAVGIGPFVVGPAVERKLEGAASVAVEAAAELEQTATARDAADAATAAMRSLLSELARQALRQPPEDSSDVVS